MIITLLILSVFAQETMPKCEGDCLVFKLKPNTLPDGRPITPGGDPIAALERKVEGLEQRIEEQQRINDLQQETIRYLIESLKIIARKAIAAEKAKGIIQ